MSRIRTNFITNRMANGAPTVSNGLVVSGVTTTTSLNVTGNVSVGGTLTYEDVTNIDSVGIITARTDITLGDSIIHYGDTNTKVRFPSNDTISLETNGNERLRVNSSGLVSITGDIDVDGHTNLDNVSIAGVTTVTNNYFDFKPTGGGNAHFRILSTGTGDAGIFFDAANGDISGSDYCFIGQKNNLDFVIDANANAGNIDFTRAGTTQIRIDSSGRVLMGTTTEGSSSADDLTIATTGTTGMTIRSGTSNNGNIEFSDGTSGQDEYRGIVQYAHSDNSMRFYTNAAEKVRITSAGYVGIGTDSPDNLLEIFKGSTGTYLKMGGDDAQNGRALTFTSGNTSSNGALHTIDAISGNGAIAFATAGTERMRITSYVSGNINVPVWYGSQDTQHNVANGTFVRIINLGNDVTNPSMNNGGWDESTGTFTAQAGQAGTYYVFGGGGIDDIQANDYIHLRFFKNGSAVGPYARHTNGTGTNQISDARHMMIVTLAVGDTIDLRIYHQEGSTEPTEPNRCFFGGYRLSV